VVGAAKWMLAATVVAVFSAAAPVKADVEIKGTVMAPDGKPAADSSVRLYYAHDITGYGVRWLTETQSDKLGRFVVSVPDYDAPAICPTPSHPPRLCLVATRAGEAAGVTEFLAGRLTDYVLRLEEGRTITFTVVDQKGEAVSGVNVLLDYTSLPQEPDDPVDPRRSVWETRYPDVAREVFRAVSERSGLAVLKDVPAVALPVRLIHPEKGQAAAHVWKGINELRIALAQRDKPFQVVGTAVDADTGKPIPGILISHAGGSLSAGAWGITNDKGRVDLSAHRIFAAVDTSIPAVYAQQAVSLEPAGDGPFDLTFRMKRGTLTQGRVLDWDSRKPIARALVTQEVAGDDGAKAAIGRLTDREGRFVWASSDRTSRIAVAGAPPGYIQLATKGGPAATGRDQAGDELTELVKIAPLGSAKIVVRKPNGVALENASVTAFTSGIGTTWQAVTDAKGEVIFAAVPLGEELTVYASSGDKALAAMTQLVPSAKSGVPALAIRLQPALTGKVSLVNGQGTKLPGSVSVALAAPGGATSRPISMGQTRDANEATAVPGLLAPGDYWVSAQAPGYRPPNKPARWRVRKNEGAPTLTITMKELPPPPPPASEGMYVRTERDFNRDLQTLADALPREDPIQKYLTWYIEKQGLTIADAENYEVKRYRGLLSYDRVTVSAIAFGELKVWVGTDAGLFAWDRRERYWSLFAVGGKVLDRPVTEMTLRPDGKLVVAVEEAANHSSVHVYDVAAGKWVDAN
jgi:hypothetical protein